MAYLSLLWLRTERSRRRVNTPLKPHRAPAARTYSTAEGEFGYAPRKPRVFARGAGTEEVRYRLRSMFRFSKKNINRFFRAFAIGVIPALHGCFTNCTIYGCSPGPLEKLESTLEKAVAENRCPKDVNRFQTRGPIQIDGYFLPRRQLISQGPSEPLGHLLGQGFTMMETERLLADGEEDKIKSVTTRLFHALAANAVGPQGRYFRFSVVGNEHPACNAQRKLLERFPEYGAIFAGYGMPSNYCIAAENTNELKSAYLVGVRRDERINHIYLRDEWFIRDTKANDFHARLYAEYIDPPPSWYWRCGDYGFNSRVDEILNKTLLPKGRPFPSPIASSILRTEDNSAEVVRVNVVNEIVYERAKQELTYGELRPHIEPNATAGLYFGSYHTDVLIARPGEVRRVQLRGFSDHFFRPKMVAGRVFLIGIGRPRQAPYSVDSRKQGWILSLSETGELESAIPLEFDGISLTERAQMRIEDFDIAEGRLKFEAKIYQKSSSDTWSLKKTAILLTDPLPVPTIDAARR